MLGYVSVEPWDSDPTRRVFPLHLKTIFLPLLLRSDAPKRPRIRVVLYRASHRDIHWQTVTTVTATGVRTASINANQHAKHVVVLGAILRLLQFPFRLQYFQGQQSGGCNCPRLVYVRTRHQSLA